MKNREVLIICRQRDVSADERKLSYNGILSWAGHINNKYFSKSISEKSSIKKIKSKIYNNISMPEWIGNHRFGLFDLLNYVLNEFRYVYNPSSQQNFFDPIGIPTITSIHIYEYLLKEGYNPVNIDNIKGKEKYIKALLKNNPLAVILSTTYFSSADELKQIICSIRRMDQNVPIIIGSMSLLIHVDSNNRLKKDYEDLITENIYYILEEFGLSTLNLLLQRLEKKTSMQDIPNIVYLYNSEIHYTESVSVPTDFNLIFPDWSISEVSNTSKGVAFIRASQGCAFKCKFCTFPKATIKFKQRSVESIRQELITINSSGIKNFAFTDDNFAVNPKRIQEICSMMIKENFDFNWFAGIRASAITEANAKQLKDAGCSILCVGLESGDDRMLKLMDKKTSTTQNMKCLEILDKNGILAYGSFLIGFPGETIESIEKTKQWINDSPLKLYKVFMFYLLSGSIIYDEQMDNNIEYFGNRYDYNLWKTPTLDALKASELLKQFILDIKKAALIYNYSPMYAFFPFLLKGYSVDDALNFFKIRTELVKSELSDPSWFSRRKFRNQKLLEIKSLLKP